MLRTGIPRGVAKLWTTTQVVYDCERPLFNLPLLGDAHLKFLMNRKSKNSKKNAQPRRRKTGKRTGVKNPVVMHGNSYAATVDSFLPIFENIATRKLRYATTVQVVSAGGALSTYVFTLSGLYDPDISGTGHQPMGFDQIMQFYEHYHVLHASVHVTFRNNSAANGFCALKVAPDTAAPADYDSMIEEGRCVVDTLDGLANINTNKVLRCSVNVPGVNGLTRANFLANEDLRGGATFNPAEQTYLHLCAYSPTVTNLSIFASIVIEYTAVFTEPRNLTASFRNVEAKRSSTNLPQTNTVGRR